MLRYRSSESIWNLQCFKKFNQQNLQAKKSEAKFTNKDIAIIKGGIFIFYYSYERSKIVVLLNLIGGVLSCFGSNLIQKSSF
ncbi:hypothetical protein [Campylobacter fetus]|uniref:hypothetical protein n=1 Tax=Campylobacter fetus TaxID=196 RepID=UPI00112FAC24|nr:hypothetical protein [Campylobacter fetus]